MIVFLEKKFARTKAEFTDSLFEGRETCAGWYKVTKRSVRFYNERNELFAVVNSRGVLCAAHPHPVKKGKTWYNLATPDIFAETLSSMLFSEQKASYERLLGRFRVGSDERGAILKWQ